MNGWFARSWHRLRYFASDAWDEWHHSPGVNLLALATLASVLFLGGLVTLVLSNVAVRVADTGQDVRIHVFLDDVLQEDGRLALERQLNAEPGVVIVEYVDKLRALEDYRAWAPDMAQLAGELDLNPLPASFAISLEQGPNAEIHADRILASLAGAVGVESVRFDRALAERLESMIRLARVGGIAVATLIFVAVAFVMASVLRLAVYARRDEIDIMLLVGATPAFVRGPFLVAGIVQGLAGSVLALFVVEGLRQLALSRAGTGTFALIDLVAANPLPPQASGAIVLAGIAVSGIGSWFAVRGHALR
jgi:cell division transport system permease protein